MAHHRNTALRQKSDSFRHAAAAFDLDRSAAGLLHHPRRRHESLLLGGFVTAERHIDHDQRALRAAHHGKPLQDHHVERNRDGRLEPMHHHAERIADQNEIAMAVEQARGVRVVGRETDDRLTSLAGANVRRGQPLDFLLCGHVRCS